VFQWPEQVVNAQRSDLGKTRGSRPHEVFKMYTLFLLPSFLSYDIVQMPAPCQAESTEVPKRGVKDAVLSSELPEPEPRTIGEYV